MHHRREELGALAAGAAGEEELLEPGTDQPVHRIEVVGDDLPNGEPVLEEVGAAEVVLEGGLHDGAHLEVGAALLSGQLKLRLVLPLPSSSGF